MEMRQVCKNSYKLHCVLGRYIPALLTVQLRILIVGVVLGFGCYNFA